MVADGLAKHGTQLSCSNGLQLFYTPPPFVYQHFHEGKTWEERRRFINSCIFVILPIPPNVNSCTTMISALPSGNNPASFCNDPSMDPSSTVANSLSTDPPMDPSSNVANSLSVDPPMDHRSIVITHVPSANTSATSTLPSVTL